MPLLEGTAEPISVRAFLADLSYEEIHALQIGAAILFLAALANASVLLSAYITILLWALGIRGFPTRETATGDPKLVPDGPEYQRRAEMYRELEEYTDRPYTHHHPPPPDFSSPHVELLRQIRREPHYFIGGGIIGDRIGATIHYYLHGSWPTIYDDLPGIVDLLLVVT